ncbi:MAG TPA: choice-of-anchor W domain-containing protein, partial [Gammaproteobacteria bacterium]|nr:choice-of-anchor W domain-containing protein [Gammaproteobacteria bacterium]
VNGYTLKPFVAEGRIGGPGTHEIDVGTNTASSSDFDAANHNWPRNETEPFSLTWDGTTATFTVGGGNGDLAPSSLGGDTVSYSSFGDLHGFNSLLIRTATPYSGTQVAFSNMQLNGKSLPDYTNNYNMDATQSDRLVKWLGIPHAGPLHKGFTLTGDVAMNWPSENKPSQSNLAFQIKGAHTTHQVPVPGTGVLVVGGMLAFWQAGRRRKV